MQSQRKRKTLPLMTPACCHYSSGTFAAALSRSMSQSFLRESEAQQPARPCLPSMLGRYATKPLQLFYSRCSGWPSYALLVRSQLSLWRCFSPALASGIRSRKADGSLPRQRPKRRIASNRSRTHPRIINGHGSLSWRGQRTCSSPSSDGRILRRESRTPLIVRSLNVKKIADHGRIASVLFRALTGTLVATLGY